MYCFRQLASVVLFGFLLCPVCRSEELPTAARLEKEFANPSMEYWPRTRYWWFGGAVTREELARELKGMKEQGLAGVEIQSVYDAAPQVKSHKPVDYASPEFFDRVAMCIEEAAKLGMKVDFTPGSGWPYAGPWIDKDHAGQSLESKTIFSEGPGKWMESFQTTEPVIAVTMRQNDDKPAQVITNWQNGFALPEGKWKVTWFWAKLGGVGPHKRSNPRDRGPVLDHLSAIAMDFHLHHCVQPVLDRVGKLIGNTFESLFIDSWELGKPTWTTDFLDQFRQRRGYDLTPYLHMLTLSGTGIVAQVQWDYDQTLRDLIVDRCYGELTRWSHQHGLQSRAQAHGSPSDWEDSYGAADIPEFEMDFKQPAQDVSIGAEQAFSAAHVYRCPIVSCESFTWLTEHWRATLHDLREQADAIFACGANQLVFHGYSYSPPEAGFPGWSFYASCEIDQSNPFWPYLRALSDYLSRNCLLLRSGRPVADIAVYGTREFPQGAALLSDRVTDRVLCGAARMERNRLVAGFGRYRVLILDSATVPLETMETLRNLVENGLVVSALQLPSDVATFKDHDAETRKLSEIVATLFPDKPGLSSRNVGKGKVYWTSQSNVASVLHQVGIEPQLQSRDMSGVHWLHRQGADYDLFLLHNASTRAAVRQEFSFRAVGCLELWNAHSGQLEQIPYHVETNRVVATIEIGPKRSQLVLIRRDKPATAFAPSQQAVARQIRQIDGPWTVTFQSIDTRKPFERSFKELVDWTTIDDLEHFAGTAVYRTRFDLPRQPEGTVFLEFGNVLDVASVVVNGESAGTIFEPPYRVKVTGLLRVGNNDLQIKVANRAENAIGTATANWTGAGKWPGYFFVNRAYKPYDPVRAEVHPSGLFGPVALVAD